MTITDVSPARLMAAVVVAVGHGVTTTADWKTTYGLMPSEAPTRRITVMTTSPLVHGKDPDGTLSYHMGVQVTVRAKTQEEGTVKCQQLVKRLLQAKPQSPITVTIGINQYAVKHVVLASGPVYVTTNENKDAEVFSINLLFVAELVP